MALLPPYSYALALAPVISSTLVQLKSRGIFCATQQFRKEYTDTVTGGVVVVGRRPEMVGSHPRTVRRK